MAMMMNPFFYYALPPTGRPASRRMNLTSPTMVDMDMSMNMNMGMNMGMNQNMGMGKFYYISVALSHWVSGLATNNKELLIFDSDHFRKTESIYPTIFLLLLNILVGLSI